MAVRSIHTILRVQVSYPRVRLDTSALTASLGGGHAPDIIAVCGQSNVLPSSTNPTMPYADTTVEEHLDVRPTVLLLNALI